MKREFPIRQATAIQNVQRVWGKRGFTGIRIKDLGSTVVIYAEVPQAEGGHSVDAICINRWGRLDDTVPGHCIW